MEHQLNEHSPGVPLAGQGREEAAHGWGRNGKRQGRGQRVNGAERTKRCGRAGRVFPQGARARRGLEAQREAQDESPCRSGSPLRNAAPPAHRAAHARHPRRTGKERGGSGGRRAGAQGACDRAPSGCSPDRRATQTGQAGAGGGGPGRGKSPQRFVRGAE